MLNVDKVESLSASLSTVKQAVNNTKNAHVAAQAIVAASVSQARITAKDHADAKTELKSIVAALRTELAVVDSTLRKTRDSLLTRLLAWFGIHVVSHKDDLPAA